MEIFFISWDIFTKFGVYHCPRQRYYLRKKYSDRITIAYSCHTNWLLCLHICIYNILCIFPHIRVKFPITRHPPSQAFCPAKEVVHIWVNSKNVHLKYIPTIRSCNSELYFYWINICESISEKCEWMTIIPLITLGPSQNRRRQRKPICLLWSYYVLFLKTNVAKRQKLRRIYKIRNYK